MQVDLHSVPALVSFVLMAILSAVSWLGRRDRVTVAFALFTTLLTLVSLFGFLGQVARDPERMRLLLRLTFGSLTLAFWAGLYYVLVLTGYHRRLDERVLGLRLKHFVVLAVGFMAMAQLLLQTTAVLMDFGAGAEPPRFVIRAHPANALLATVGVYILVVFFAILVKALRAAKAGTPERSFLLLNAIGVAEIYLSGPLFAKLLAFWEIDGRPWVFASYTVASVIFYIALVRYQYQRIEAQVIEIEQLNRSLEQKVEQRTLHLRQAQARLAQAEKMASLGRLAAGVAHEVNTPLGALRSTNATLGGWRARLAAVLAVRAEGDGARGDEEVVDRALTELEQGQALIEQAASRVEQTVQRLRAFAQLDRAEQREVDLHRSVDDTLALEPAIQQGRVRVHRDYDEGLPAVTCHPAQINQVLQNVVSNAVDAMEGGGDLSIRTGRDAGQAVIAVRDSGSGIPEDLLRRVFDPGFTTKGRGVGTGLGLAICYQVMRDHQGSIEIDSVPGEGTRVTLSLPLRGTEAAAEAVS